MAYKIINDPYLIAITITIVVYFGGQWIFFKQFLPFRSKCSQCKKKCAMIVVDEDYRYEKNGYIVVNQERVCKHCDHTDNVLRRRSNNILS